MDDRERQLEIEGAQRRPVAMIAVAAGLLYLIGEFLVGLVISAKTPTVGVLQGLAPALQGLKAAQVDPRTAIQLFVDHHAVLIVVLFVIDAIGLAAMRWPLLYLHRATVLRSGQSSTFLGYLANYAPAVLGIATFAQFGVAAAFLMVSMRAMRVGLLPKLVGWLGVIAGVLFLLPLVPIPLIQCLWLTSLAVILVEFGGQRRPPAWDAGEPIPWPSGAQLRAERAANARRAGGRGLTPAPAPSAPGSPSPAASKKRKRRRS
jgi:hypothetical protein